eukprot:TRINITY_DN12517_c0_g1_i1.p1 TRINITY_DN12517_c0_g1~~TRINITY_DN12517_c0_g1_i1.p1  ORF type:complete len:370 (-),score=91.81 TRINITY_DN12517_c0_g1_i1:461-1429(-)
MANALEKAQTKAVNFISEFNNSLPPGYLTNENFHLHEAYQLAPPTHSKFEYLFSFEDLRGDNVVTKRLFNSKVTKILNEIYKNQTKIITKDTNNQFRNFYMFDCDDMGFYKVILDDYLVFASNHSSKSSDALNRRSKSSMHIEQEVKTLEFDFQDPSNLIFKIDNKRIPIHVQRRITQWFWQRDDGTIEKFSDGFTLLFHILYRMMGVNPLCLMLGYKYAYVMDFEMKIQRNMETQRDRKIFSEEDFLAISEWKESDIETSYLDGINMVQQIDQTSDKWKKISDMLCCSLPKNEKAFRNVLGIEKPIHQILQIEQLCNPNHR